MKIPAIDILNREIARKSHFEFIKYCWMRDDPFIEAVENPFQREICKEIDDGLDKLKRGESTYLMVLMCFGHGKSNILSDYLPAHFLGEFPDSPVLLGTHSDNKASDFSRFGRNLIKSEKFQALYPNIKLSSDHAGVEEWGIEGRHGTAKFFGMQSGSAGKRGALILIDDFFGKREDADSETKSNTVWERVTNDIMTRRAPATFVCLLVTPWNNYDPVARIQRKMKDDDGFPQFKIMKYPAMSGKYASGYLFPERFGPQWYSDMTKIIGPYATASQMQCDPQERNSGLIRTDKIVMVDPTEFDRKTAHLRFVRGWDLASSTKETAKDDPDFTSGCKMAVVQLATSIKGVTIPVLFIADFVRGQWEAPERNKIIVQTSIHDGDRVGIGVEAFGGYKDSFTTLKQILLGYRSVLKVNLPGDKRAKAQVLIPCFESGNVYMKKGSWNDAVIRQIRDFDGGQHDDDIDAMCVAFAMHKRQTRMGNIPGV